MFEVAVPRFVNQEPGSALVQFCHHRQRSARENLLPLFAMLRALALIFMIMLGAASSAQAGKSFSDNGDGTVSDPTTGLTWMRCAMGQTWVGTTCAGTARVYTWDQAVALSSTVTFAGQSDWRLPNIRELQTIVERSLSDPAIDRIAFPNSPSADFWSSSAQIGGVGGHAWPVRFSDGQTRPAQQRSSLNVRLVRSGRPLGLLDVARPSNDYVDHGDGTVTHTPTGLMWQRCGVGKNWDGHTCSFLFSKRFTWSAAKAWTSNFAGKTDWRLPSIEELVSLVDYSKEPAINEAVFPATSIDSFWSGSRNASHPGYAWGVHSAAGHVWDVYLPGELSVRLVRGAPFVESLGLGVNKVGTGDGTITSSPAGIDCGNTCSAPFDIGTNVTLTPTPAAGAIFSGWGFACSGTGTCTVSVNTWRGVIAHFTLIPDCIFDWAERTYPQFFAPAGTGSQTLKGTPYYYRYFSTTRNYLATSTTDNRLYAVGATTGGKLVDLGPVATFQAAAACQ